MSGAPVMLSLGGFKFGINTAAFQQLQRSTAWRWPAQERFGRAAALQSTGPGEDRITLSGAVYPDFRGGIRQVAELRALGAKGEALQLISSTGRVVGRWVIESLEETQTVFNRIGNPRKQEFTLTIRRFE